MTRRFDMAGVKSKLVVSALTFACASTAMAYEPMSFDPYVGGNYGYLDVNDSDFEDDNNAYQFRVGTNILPFLGIEAAYNDFGDYGNSFANMDVDGYSLAAVGRLPITPAFGLYAKAGQLWWDANYDVAGFNGDSDQDDFFWGVGAELEMTENLDVVFSYDRYKIDIDNDLTEVANGGDYESDLNFASVGVNLSF